MNVSCYIYVYRGREYTFAGAISIFDQEFAKHSGINTRPYTVNVYTLDRRQYVSRVLKTNKSDNHKILIAVK